jgi:hypothetical protein
MNPTAPPTDPATFIDQSLHHLGRGVRDRRSGFHIITIATIGANLTPQARSVVLRGCTATTGKITFHTDRRSPKCTELTTNPRAALLAYAPEAKLQIRAESLVTLHTGDEIAQTAWHALSPNARQIYRTAATPGSPTPTTTPHQLEETNAAHHFTVAHMQLTRIDVLLLHADGHHRATGRFLEGALIDAAFVVA